MRTTPILANRVRTTLGWIDDNAAMLPGDWGLTLSVTGVAIHWHDCTAADYTRGVLERQFGHGHDDRVDTTLTRTTWSPEGDRPELTVYHTTVRSTVA